MKKIQSLILILIISLLLCSCGKKNEEPKIEQIRAICELTTVKAYYNNVAKSVKDAGRKNWIIPEKDREFWIEYDGVAEIGIDMKKVTMKVKDETVCVTMPDAEILRTYIVRETFNEDSYKISADNWWNKNKITTEDQLGAVNKAQDEMKIKVAENIMLFERAENVAKETIKNYIKKIGEIAGVELNIEWKKSKK